MIELITAAGGNLGSVRRCLERLGAVCNEVSSPGELTGTRPIVLPGVGEFGSVMRALQNSGLSARIKQRVEEGTPFLGICVGLQVLLSESEESPGIAGLNLIPGQVLRFNQGKVPQIGWNKVTGQALEKQGYAYFVNSYYASPLKPDTISLTARYYCDFPAALRSGNITAFQFHPEKSGDFGMSILERWFREFSR